MQLVAYGAQDIYLTGNPQITFFKVVYRRHTNFSMESINQTFSGVGKPGQTATATISRNGDLIHKIYLQSKATSNTVPLTADGLVTEAEIEIGGQRIDRQTSEWRNVWNELSTSDSKALGLKSMQGQIGVPKSTGVNTVLIPLTFWFNRNPGLALPLIALQYHEVNIILEQNWNGCFSAMTGQQLWVEYIYLDTDERRRFAQVSHEYLIEQVQRETASASTSQKLLYIIARYRSCGTRTT